MAKEWYEKTDIEDFTNRDQQFLLLAYRNTFCKSEEGQQVLCHLKTILEKIPQSDNKFVTSRILLDTILNNCGIVGNLKIIKALSGVAAAFSVPKKEETDNLNI